MSTRLQSQEATGRQQKKCTYREPSGRAGRAATRSLPVLLRPRTIDSARSLRAAHPSDSERLVINDLGMALGGVALPGSPAQGLLRDVCGGDKVAIICEANAVVEDPSHSGWLSQEARF